MTDDADLTALSEFVVGNDELERLEEILDEFNVFVALSAVRQEVRHSDFLAWLLDPSESHGLGAYPLRRLLKDVASRSPTETSGVTVFEADTWDLDGCEIRREWNHIDILILDRANSFVCVIENKVESSEHSRQLQRYRKRVAADYPDLDRRLFLYLTPAGDPPSDDAYRSVSYARIADLVAGVMERRATQMSPEVASVLRQYERMIRRYIVEDGEIQALCRTIYERHRRALDLLFEYRPDRAAMYAAIMQDLLTKDERIVTERLSKRFSHFIPKALDFVPARGSADWSKGGRILLFELENNGSEVKLRFVIGPGDQEVRRRVFEVARKSPHLFKGQKTLTEKWYQLFSEVWIAKKDYPGLDEDGARRALEKRLERLMDSKLSELEAALSELKEGWPTTD